MFLLLSVFVFVLLVLSLVFIFVLILVDKLKSLINPIPKIGDETPKIIKETAKPKLQVEPEKPVTPPKTKFTQIELIMIFQGLVNIIEPIIFLFWRIYDTIA